MNFIKNRIARIEKAAGAKACNRIEGIVRLIINVDKPDAPMRYATGEGMEFFAGDDEPEDEFCKRVGAAMPKKSGKLWRVLMYANHARLSGSRCNARVP